MSAEDDLTKEQMDELSRVFKTEALEHVKSIAEALFTLENNPTQSIELLIAAFRETHSLKGSAGTLGFNRVSTITHRFEDAISALRQSNTPIDIPTLDLLLETLEAIRNAIATSDPGESHLQDSETALMEALDKRFPKNKDSQTPSSNYPQISTIPPLGSSSLPPGNYSTVPPGGEKNMRQAGSEFIRVDENSIDTVIAQFGELFETSLQLESFDSDMTSINLNASRLTSALSSFLGKLEGTSFEEEGMELVDSAKNLSTLLNTSQNRFKIDNRLLAKLIQRTQESLKAIRVAPISTIGVDVRTQVRKTAKATGKKVEVHLLGGEYELDRAVLDAIRNPMMHLIRNSVDHGIESPEDRRRNGKSTTGTISIAAYHTGDSIELTISDDGRGINTSTIKTTLREKYSMPEAQINDLSDAQLYDYLFESGFSTRQDVSQISGRGVGLDVVKYSIERLGGEVRLETKLGEGTKTILKLPLTISTIRCLLVHEANRTFAIPASNLEKVLVFNNDLVSSMGGNKVIRYKDSNVPFTQLAEALELQNNDTNDIGCESRFVAILKLGDRRFAFGIEQIIEYSQIILKPLGDLLERIPNISGLALLGTGKLAIVLNPSDLVRNAGGLTSKHVASLRSIDKPELKRRTILIVDDSISTRTLQKTLVQSAGYNVLTATDGLNAINTLINSKVDLVISDVQMPNMNGFELSKHIKRRHEFKHIPVILVTSLGSNEDKAQGLAAGADAHIIKKELSRVELLETITQLLD